MTEITLIKVTPVELRIGDIFVIGDGSRRQIIKSYKAGKLTIIDPDTQELIFDVGIKYLPDIYSYINGVEIQENHLYREPVVRLNLLERKSIQVELGDTLVLESGEEWSIAKGVDYFLLEDDMVVGDGFESIEELVKTVVGYARIVDVKKGRDL